MAASNADNSTATEAKPGSIAGLIAQGGARPAAADHAEGSMNAPRIAIVGCPHDAGVSLNNGRPGAAQGPAAIRAALARAGQTFDADRRRHLSIDLSDAGDAPCPLPASDERGELERALAGAHTAVHATFAELHRKGFVTIGLGGGHDLTLPMVAGMAEGRAIAPFDPNANTTDPINTTGVGGVNIDAHLDVRETTGSGMPFRRLIERRVLAPQRFTVLGAGRFANSEAHVRWLEEGSAQELASDLGGGRVVTIDQARGVGTGPLWRMRVEEALRRAHLFGDNAQPGFVTFDLDAIDASAAPGVSAINPCGLTSAEATEAAYLAGLAPGVVHFDVMELSPKHDENSRTARLAAAIVAAFLAGFDERQRTDHDDDEQQAGPR